MPAKKSGPDGGDRAEATAVAETRWDQQAGFSLFFLRRSAAAGVEWRTQIHHEESHEEVLIDGTQPGDWTAWITRQAKLPTGRARAARASAGGAREHSGGGSTTGRGAPLKIVGVDVTESLPGEPGTLATEVRFRVAGPAARKLAESAARYRVETYSVDIESGVAQFIASTEDGLRTGERTTPAARSSRCRATGATSFTAGWSCCRRTRRWRSSAAPLRGRPRERRRVGVRRAVDRRSAPAGGGGPRYR